MSGARVLSAAELVAFGDEQRAAGRTVGLANGAFDLLHVGHTRYLKQARALGDVLLVALNGDVSVRALKGPTRPVNGEDDRAEVISELRSVD